MGRPNQNRPVAGAAHDLMEPNSVLNDHNLRLSYIPHSCSDVLWFSGILNYQFIW